mgnify:CR=1 FL=1
MKRLRELYNDSIPFALELIQEYIDALNNHTHLGLNFQTTFMGQER